jgi:hypothetical protein
MCVAFTQKMKEGKAGLDFTLLLSDEEIGNIVASLEGWNELSGPEKKERSVSLFGEACKTKGYKLAAKYNLAEVGSVLHVLTKGGGNVDLLDGGGEGTDEMLSSADGPKRLVSEGAMFDVLWDTHVTAGDHCKGRTFEARVKSNYVGIPRCSHPAPSHPTARYPTPSHPTLPRPILLHSPLPFPLPSQSYLSPIPLSSLSYPIPLPSHPTLGGCSWRLSRVAVSARAEFHASQSRLLGLAHRRRRRCRHRLSHCYQRAGHGLSTQRLAMLTTCMLRAARRSGISPRNTSRPRPHQRSRRQR